MKFLFLVALFLLTLAPVVGAADDPGALARRFIEQVRTGQAGEAEKLLAIDADPDLRLALLNPEDARAHEKAFARLRFHSAHSAPGESWQIYQVESSAEYLLFAVRDRRIQRMIPLAVPTLRVIRLRLPRSNAEQTLVSLIRRVQALPFVTAAGRTGESALEIHTAGFAETNDLHILLTACGRFSLRRAVRRGRETLDWAPLEGIQKRERQAVAPGILLEHERLRRALPVRNSLGLVEIKVETDAEGRRRLTREFQERGGQDPYLAVLDGKIVRRVQASRSFLAGIVFLEGVPRPEDAQVLAALLSAPPLTAPLSILGEE